MKNNDTDFSAQDLTVLPPWEVYPAGLAGILCCSLLEATTTRLAISMLLYIGIPVVQPTG